MGDGTCRVIDGGFTCVGAHNIRQDRRRSVQYIEDWADIPGLAS